MKGAISTLANNTATWQFGEGKHWEKRTSAKNIATNLESALEEKAKAKKSDNGDNVVLYSIDTEAEEEDEYSIEENNTGEFSTEDDIEFSIESDWVDYSIATNPADYDEEFADENAGKNW